MNKYIKIKVFNLQKGGASLAFEDEEPVNDLLLTHRVAEGNNKKLLVLCYAQRRNEPPYVKFFEDNIKNNSLNNYDVDLVGFNVVNDVLDLYHEEKKITHNIKVNVKKEDINKFEGFGYLYDIIIEEHCPKHQSEAHWHDIFMLDLTNIKRFINNLLKPGGLFILIGVNSYLNYLRRSDIKDLVEINQIDVPGWKAVNQERLYIILKKNEKPVNDLLLTHRVVGEENKTNIMILGRPLKEQIDLAENSEEANMELFIAKLISLSEIDLKDNIDIYFCDILGNDAQIVNKIIGGKNIRLIDVKCDLNNFQEVIQKIPLQEQVDIFVNDWGTLAFFNLDILARLIRYYLKIGGQAYLQGFSSINYKDGQVQGIESVKLIENNALAYAGEAATRRARAAQQQGVQSTKGRQRQLPPANQRQRPNPGQRYKTIENNDNFNIYIRHIDNTRSTISVNSNTTIREILQHLKAIGKTTHPLSFVNNRLEFDKSISSYRIQKEATLHQVLPLKSRYVGDFILKIVHNEIKIEYINCNDFIFGHPRLGYNAMGNKTKRGRCLKITKVKTEDQKVSATTEDQKVSATTESHNWGPGRRL